jgi:hypothetical protein
MLTVGDCQQIYNKYKLDISEHTKETTKLCEVILRLENAIAKGSKIVEIKNVPFIIECPACGEKGGYHNENCEYVISF